jgi:hypothetical protein
VPAELTSPNPAPAVQTWTAHVVPTVTRRVWVYAVARAMGLLAITASIAAVVLVLATVATVVRG